MAKQISKSNKYVTLHERDYITLLQDHLVLKALKISGIENHPAFKAVQSILKDGHIETHIHPVEEKYR